MIKESIALQRAKADSPITCRLSGNVILLSWGHWLKAFSLISTTDEGSTVPPVSPTSNIVAADTTDTTESHQYGSD